MKLIRATEVAERLGVKTGTLAKWRHLGRGPKGWIHLSATLVCYPETEVDRFISERTTKPLEFPPVFRLSSRG